MYPKTSEVLGVFLVFTLILPVSAEKKTSLKKKSKTRKTQKSAEVKTDKVKSKDAKNLRPVSDTRLSTDTSSKNESVSQSNGKPVSKSAYPPSKPYHNNSSYCPYKCYKPEANFRMINWCNSQAFCKNKGKATEHTYYSSRKHHCPRNCLNPYFDYAHMKNICLKNNLCEKINHAKRIIKLNYSLRNYKYAKVGKILRFTLKNLNYDNVSWSITNMPSSASFNPLTLEFIWRPKTWQVGANFVTFTVSVNGQTASKTIEIKVKEEWETFFLPGIAYTNYIPSNSEKLGIYHGISVNYILFAWVHRNDKRGPSHGKVYFKLDVMQSSEDIKATDGSSAKDLFYWAFGLDLSFERNPKRPFAIPYFGLELGGSYSKREVAESDCNSGDCMKQLGGVMHITPTFGVNIWSSQNFFFYIAGGYSFPLEDYADFKGWRTSIGFNFTFW